MNWIRTDIDIGLRVKGFEVDFYFLEEHFQIGRNKWDITILSFIFEKLQKNNHIPKTASLIRVSMPIDIMAIIFVAQDDSFVPVDRMKMYPIERITLKDGSQL